MENEYSNPRYIFLRCISSTCKFFSAIVQRLLALSSCVFTIVCALIQWQLWPDPAMVQSVDYDTFDRSWRNFRRRLQQYEQVEDREDMQRPTDDGLFGFLEKHLVPASNAYTIEPLKSAGVMEIALEEDGLVVTTRLRSTASNAYVEGLSALALCLVCDMIFWPMFLHQMGTLMRLQYALDWYSFLTVFIPAMAGLLCVSWQVQTSRRQVN